MDYSLEPIIETDERNYCVEMMKRLHIQRKSEQFCDVILEVGSGDDYARLKTHRVVLCAASPFFYNALNSDMKEKKEGVIRLEETSKAVMEELLEYLYTGHIDINENNANFDFIAAADYFVMPSLKALCGKIILKTLALDNCVSIYYFALKYRCEELQKGAKDFILANFVAVAKTEDFLNLSSKQVEEWISSDEIIVEGEEDVFQVVVRWMERNDDQNHNFYELFRHIRCIYLPRVYLLNVALHDPLVKNNIDCSNCAQDALKMVFGGGEECYFAQSPRNCLKTHENAIVACGENSTVCYIPSEDKWYKLSCMLSTRHCLSHTISVCYGKCFFFGGNNIGFPAQRYDPATNLWSPLESFKQKINFCTVVTFQGFLYVIGGVEEEENKRLSTVQRYNPDIDLWQVVSSLSSPRSSVCAVATGNHLYAIGGRSDFTTATVNIVERFDPKEKVWCLVAPILESRIGACGVAVNEKLFVFGGLMREEYTHSSLCEMYDPVTDMWSSITNTVTPRVFASAVNFKGDIFVCTWDFGEDASLQIYDFVTNEWKFCTMFPQSDEDFKISSLRIPRAVLNRCKVLS